MPQSALRAPQPKELIGLKNQKNFQEKDHPKLFVSFPTIEWKIVVSKIVSLSSKKF